MRYIFILALVLLTSCVQYDYIEGESMYDCGIVIGGERRGSEHYLWIEFPDGRFWYNVTEKAYYQYDILEEICFNTIQW